jgi:parallel beta-helix repeat protein
MNKPASVVLSVACLVASCFFLVPLGAGATIIVVPDDYASLPAALDHAASGDTVLIKEGVYTEQTLQVSKPLTLISSTIGGATVNLHPPQHQVNYFGSILMVYNHSIQINADNVNLIGLNIVSDGGDISANGNNLKIADNSFQTQTAQLGFYFTGNASKIINNTLSSLAVVGSNNTLTGNRATSMSVTGTFNFINQNGAGGITLTGSKNAVTGNSFIGGEGVGIHLLGADYNIVTNNTESDSGVGIAIGYTGTGGSCNLFAGNTVEDAGLWGILLGNGSYNVFYGNQIANNLGYGHDGYGLAMGGTHSQVDNNLFFGNLFENNAKNFGTNWEVLGSNSFDNCTVGNYWDDYLTLYPNASELADLGTGDTPYLVYPNHTDNHPLMSKPPVSSVIPSLPNPWAELMPLTSPEDLLPNVFPTPPPTLPPIPMPSPTPRPTPYIWSTGPDSWAAMTSLQPKFYGTLGAAVVDGKIYFVGSNVNMQYDPQTDTWIEKTPSPSFVYGGNGGVAECSGKIYVIGSKTTEMYSPSTDTWENRTAMPTERAGFTPCAVDGKIYVIGGAKPAPYGVTATTDVNEVYDPKTDSWMQMAMLPSAVTGYSSVVLDGKIYIMGGYAGDLHQSALTQVQVYDPQTNQWTQGTPLQEAVRGGAAAITTGAIAPKRIYVIGGNIVSAGWYIRFCDHVQIYNPETDSWSFGRQMPTGRSDLALVNINDTLYALGGTNSSVTVTVPGGASQEEWDAAWDKIASTRCHANEKYLPLGHGTLPTTTATPSPTQTQTLPSPTSSVPEFPIEIIPLVMVVMFAFAVVYRRRVNVK